MKEELFVPILCVTEYDNFDEAIQLANDIEYGLTAGIFTENKEQLEQFFDKIQAGTVYANRAASATTAALVRSQPFVGWKKLWFNGKRSRGCKLFATIYEGTKLKLYVLELRNFQVTKYFVFFLLLDVLNMITNLFHMVYNLKLQTVFLQVLALIHL